MDKAYTPKLMWAIDTLDINLEKYLREGVPKVKNEALNERNYWKLQGLNKAETLKNIVKNRYFFRDAVTQQLPQ